MNIGKEISKKFVKGDLRKKVIQWRKSLWKNKSGQEILKDIEKAAICMRYFQFAKQYSIDWEIRLSNLFPHQPKIWNRVQKLLQSCSIRSCCSAKDLLYIYERMTYFHHYPNMDDAAKLLAIMRTEQIEFDEAAKIGIEKGRSDVINMIFIKKYIWPDLVRRSQKIYKEKNNETKK